MALYLTESEVNKIIDIKIAIDSVEESFRMMANGEAVNKPRERLPLGSTSMNYMSAGIDSANITGLKVYVPNPKGTKFYVHIMNAESGEIISIIEAITLSLRSLKPTLPKNFGVSTESSATSILETNEL